MILLTGATGTVGAAVLSRLTAATEPVRCLVRDPRRLGAQRVRVQIALGDLADPASFRNALRGVDTVIHLAASSRDQQRASLEELSAMATLRLVRAAERSGVSRFVFFSALGASLQSPARLLRAKALARRAVEASELESIVFAPSIVYAPGEDWLTLLTRFSHLPAIPVSGPGRALFQPIWAEDVADCVAAALTLPAAERREREQRSPIAAGAAQPDRLSGEHRTEDLARASTAPRTSRGRAPHRGPRAGEHRTEGLARASTAPRSSFELAGPETLSYEAIVRLALRALDRGRPLVSLPRPLVRACLRVVERLAGPAAFATWAEAELLDAPMISARGTADAESLGVTPLRMAAVLGGS
jgi:NADH dehydrogenase